MTKPFYILILAFCFIALTNTDCKHNPVGPGDTTKVDTTSHNFLWTSYLIGDNSYGTTSVYDVTIINDSLAYAVGDFYRNDTEFNVIKWDEKVFELQQVQYYYQGQYFYNTIHSIYAFNQNDIWFGIASVIHYDGINYISIQTPMTGIGYKMWGTSSKDLFIAGGNGSIDHYDGSNWNTISSGTSTNIDDIYGVWNKNAKQYEVYCAVTYFFKPQDRKILRIVGTTVDTVSWTPQSDVVSVWSADGSFLYAAGSSTYENSTGVWKEIPLGVYTNCVRGSAANNVFVAGDMGVIAHYNGSTWKTLVQDVDAEYNSVAVTNDRVIAVGSKNGQAYITIGKRF